jgi:uncharacterized protein YggE
MTWKKIAGVVAIVVLAMLVFRGCNDGRGMMGDHDDDHGGPSSAQGVTVLATGSVKVVPDGVSFNFAVSVLAQSSETAMSEASATAELEPLAAVAAFANGINESDNIPRPANPIAPRISCLRDGFLSEAAKTV